MQPPSPTPADRAEAAATPGASHGSVDFRRHAAALRLHAQTGTQSAVLARVHPHGVALVSADGQRSFLQLHHNANRLAHRLRALGVAPGDGVALMCSNRPEFVEVLLAALRIGARLTPMSTQLTADEAGYIVHNSQARVLFVERGLSVASAAGTALQRMEIGIEIGIETGIEIGTTSYAQALDAGSADDIQAPTAGTLMLYTSGTTGRPKGVLRSAPEVLEPQFEGSFADYRPGDVQLCAGPAYHAAPLLFDLRWPLASGVPIVLMATWDAAHALQLIAQHRITHAHLVPTMFQRLLGLPADVRQAHDLSSLRLVLHGAAPCPPAVKRAMIDWLGPVLTEYYAGTEGGDNIHVNAQDWLRKPGTVGRFQATLGHRILDDAGQDVPQGTVGRIYFRAPADNRFAYFGDAAKSAAAYRDDRFTLGDLGYVDSDGWLFLTGRSADTIISGGVNVYPREVDDVLAQHEAVAAVCTVGVPDDAWGERVLAVVVPAAGHPPGAELAAALMAHAATRLASFKRPREIVFDTALPMSATGKLLRAQVRQRFWAGRDKAI